MFVLCDVHRCPFHSRTESGHKNVVLIKEKFIVRKQRQHFFLPWRSSSRIGGNFYCSFFLSTPLFKSRLLTKIDRKVFVSWSQAFNSLQFPNPSFKAGLPRAIPSSKDHFLSITWNRVNVLILLAKNHVHFNEFLVRIRIRIILVVLHIQNTKTLL